MKWKDINVGDHIWFYDYGEDPIEKIVSDIQPDFEPDEEDGSYWMDISFINDSKDFPSRVPLEGDLTDIRCFKVNTKFDLTKAILEFLESQIEWCKDFSEMCQKELDKYRSGTE